MARTKKKRRSCSVGTSQDTENNPRGTESLLSENSPTTECQEAPSIREETIAVSHEATTSKPQEKKDDCLELKSPILVCRLRARSTNRARVKSNQNDCSISGTQPASASEQQLGSNLIGDETGDSLCISRESPLNLAWDSSMKENYWHQAIAPDIRPITPDNLLVPVSEIFSPPTQKQIRSSIRALFPNGPPPPPPVRPVRRPKKGDVPYIVNCTKRRRVPSPKCLNVFTGDKYGITSATNYDVDEPLEETPEKRSRRHPPGSGSLPKSTFNRQTNEIAERLKRYEEQPVVNTTKRSFSPLPSTSFDNETIMKNDKHFSESLDCDNFYIDDDDELPEVIWNTNNIKKEKDPTDSTTPLVSKDIKKENNPIKVNEDMNNNNSEVIVIEDFTEIQFDKYMSKEKLLGYSDVEPKNETEDNNMVHKKGNKDDYFTAQSNKHSGEPSDVICVDDTSTSNTSTFNLTQASLAAVTTQVLRASNRIASPTNKQSDQVIEVSDETENISRHYPIKPSEWNEEVQFVSEERIERPGSSNTESPDVQVVSHTRNTQSRPTKQPDIIHELQQFLNCLSGLTEQYCKRRTKKKNKRNKCKENLGGPSNDNTTPPVNDENTAPIGDNASRNESAVPSANQVPTDNSVIPSANSSPSKRLGECPICLDNLPRGFIASTNCGHVFCLECIKQSLKTSGKRCPTCRKQLRGTGYHQVFL